MAVTAQININVNSKQAEGSVEKLSGTINQFAKSANSLKTELRQVTQELQGLDPGSKRFQELSQRAGELRDTIQDTNAVINATAGNVTENFGKALGSAVQIGVAGFQGLMAVQTLFGSENEELNKSIAKMTALLNLSQAISSLGGLKDSLTQIKAGLTPVLTALGLMATEQTAVATATAAVDAALVGETIATEGATVATGGFALALNAIPFVAIATAVGLLVAGLISYSNTQKDAAEAEKKYKKELEETTKLEKERSGYVAKESSEYTTLIYQLKATNKGSERRKELIKQINTEYGTTLQNLSDEKIFQDQLNKSVEEYITLQYNKFKLGKNQEFIDQQNEKRFNAELKRNKIIANAQDLVNQGIRKSVGDALSYLEFDRKELAKAEKDIEDSKKALEGLGIRREQLTTIEDKLTQGGKVYVKQEKDKIETVKDITEETEKYAKLLEEVKNKIDRETSVLEKSDKLRLDRVSGIEKETQSINKLYGDERQSIIDNALKMELDALDEKFKKEGKTEEEYLKASQLIKDNYQTYLLDSEKKLLEQLDVYQKEDIQNVKDNYTTKEKIVQETTENILTNTKLLQIQYEKNEAIRVIDEAKGTEEEKNQAKLEVRKKYAQQEIDLLNKNLQEQNNIAKLNLDQTLADTDKTIAEKEQAQADYDQKVIKATQDTADKINEINAGVKAPLDEDKLKKSLDKIGEYVDAVVTAFNALSTTLSMIQDERSKKEEARIDGTYNYEKNVLENQLAENIISREQYDNKVKELEQQKEQETLALRRQEFQSNKRLNMANAVIAGAQAVLQALGSSPPPINFILAAIVGAASAAQFGIISSQEFQAAGGGIVPGTGSGNVDSVRSFLAPGETVINTQSSQMYPELLNSINMAGGGISLKPDLPAINKPDGELRVFGDNKINQPVRAYVVETDVTDTQKRVDRIKRSAEF